MVGEVRVGGSRAMAIRKAGAAPAKVRRPSASGVISITDIAPRPIASRTAMNGGAATAGAGASACRGRS
jgi:hypothetical protein